MSHSVEIERARCQDRLDRLIYTMKYIDTHIPVSANINICEKRARLIYRQMAILQHLLECIHSPHKYNGFMESLSESYDELVQINREHEAEEPIY